jgi:hypothetical protein
MVELAILGVNWPPDIVQGPTQVIYVWIPPMPLIIGMQLIGWYLPNPFFTVHNQTSSSIATINIVHP